jgi:outer membrane lipoprotein-sorting protein
MKTTIIIAFLATISTIAQQPNAKTILDKVDANMSSENRVFTSKMIIHGRRSSRTIESKSWSVGEEKSFTEYLSPVREKGTKMLKLEKQLWIYTPSTDRTIQIAGHMLRQSVMGSDLSYEDMLEDATLQENYSATVIGEEFIADRKCYVLDLVAKKAEIAYQKRKLWVDTERYVPLKEELFAKSGKLLKKTELSDVVQVQGRWFPRKVVFRDMLKESSGTEFIIDKIEFNATIPDYIFTKSSLKK